jgi:hypothetical protein
MPFTVEFDESGFIHATYQGDLNLGDITALMAAVAHLIKERNCFLVLSDYRQAKLAISIIDLYEIPKMIVKRGREMGVQAQRVKRALIIPASASDKFSFFETVSLNNSQSVRIFTDEGKARDWLLAPSDGTGN